MSRAGGSNRQPAHHRIFGDAGSVTIMEILLAMAILTVAAGAFTRTYLSQQRAYERQYAVQERDFSLRLAANTLMRELQEAGYHAAGDALLSRLRDWVPMTYYPGDEGVRLDANPKITLRPGGQPDLITFLLELPSDSNPTRLATRAVDGTLETVLSESRLARQYRVGDLICIGEQTGYARVTGVAGKILTIDTDPGHHGNQPLAQPFPAGTPVGEISVVTYAVFNDQNDPGCRRHRAGHPVLKRKANAGGFQPVAENISDMQISLEGDGRIRIALTARAGPPAGEAWVHETNFVRLANLSRIGIGSGCPLPAAPLAARVLGGLDQRQPCHILLAWDPVTVDTAGDALGPGECGLKGYRIFFDVAPGVFGHYVDVGVGAGSGYALDVQALGSDAYYLSVAARNGGGVGAKTAEVVLRDSVPPSPPTNLSAVWQPGVGVILTWTAPPDCDLAGFRVLRRGASGPFVRISCGLVPGWQLYFTDRAAPAGSVTYTVQAQDGGSNTSASAQAVAVNVAGPVSRGGAP